MKILDLLKDVSLDVHAHCTNKDEAIDHENRTYVYGCRSVRRKSKRNGSHY